MFGVSRWILSPGVVLAASDDFSGLLLLYAADCIVLRLSRGAPVQAPPSNSNSLSSFSSISLLGLLKILTVSYALTLRPKWRMIVHSEYPFTDGDQVGADANEHLVLTSSYTSPLRRTRL